MKKYILILLIIFLISCGDSDKNSEKKDVCENYSCMDNAECLIDGTEPRCVCLDGYYFNGDKTECISINNSCENGDIETQNCGDDNSGVQNRECIDGEWSEWGDCIIETECESGDIETQNCGDDNSGVQNRECIDGEWSEWGDCIIETECESGDIETQNCGDDNSGVQNRECIDGEWSDWGDCIIEADCQIGDKVELGSCGENGIQIQVCNQNGQWSEALCHEIEGDLYTTTVYIKNEDDGVTSYLIDPPTSSWNYFDSVHLGLHYNPVVSYHSALRFENIQIPQNSEIVSVTLSFYPANSVDRDLIRINIYGEKSVNSLPFDSSNYDSDRPDQRLKTDIKIPEDTEWPEAWKVDCISDCCRDEPDCGALWRYDCPQRKLDCWDQDVRFEVPHNLAPIVDEIISLDGWVIGNPITIFLLNALLPEDPEGSRTINDFDERGIEYNPSLTIKYRVSD